MDKNHLIRMERLRLAISLNVAKRKQSDIDIIAEHIVDMATEAKPKAIESLLYIMTSNELAYDFDSVIRDGEVIDPSFTII